MTVTIRESEQSCICVLSEYLSETLLTEFHLYVPHPLNHPPTQKINLEIKEETTETSSSVSFFYININFLPNSLTLFVTLEFLLLDSNIPTVYGVYI